MGAGMKSIRMVETRLVFATSATLFLLACAEPPDSTQSTAMRTSSLDLTIPISGKPQKDILIYGPSLFGFPDNEKTLAEAAGHNVTVADDGTWSAMTTGDFAQYRAIVFGDPTCQDTPGPLTVAEANKATWSAAVTGKMVVIGSAPISRQLLGQAKQLTTNAMNFAASGAGTGLYMSLSCYYFDAPVNTPVSVLSELGDFRVQGQITPPLDPLLHCPNDVTIVAPLHPVVQGITKPGLDNWFCSIHEASNAFPASLGVVVQDTATAVYRRAGGQGQRRGRGREGWERRRLRLRRVRRQSSIRSPRYGQERRLPLDDEGRRTDVRPGRPEGHGHRQRIEQRTAGHVCARRHRSRYRTGHGPVLAHAAR